MIDSCRRMWILVPVLSVMILSCRVDKPRGVEVEVLAETEKGTRKVHPMCDPGVVLWIDLVVTKIIVTESTREPVLILEETGEETMKEILEIDGISRTKTVDITKTEISKIQGMTVGYLIVIFSRRIAEGKVDIVKNWIGKKIVVIDILLIVNIVEKRRDRLPGNPMVACYHPANSIRLYM
jgi:hypothetical protein